MYKNVIKLTKNYKKIEKKVSLWKNSLLHGSNDVHL